MKPRRVAMTGLPFNLLAILALTICRPMLAQSAETARRPNVILLLADDLGYGDVGYLGNEEVRTPILDEMAREGIRFDRFYASASVCSPTRAALLTGRTPNRSGVFSWGWSLRPEEITVAEILKDAGYATGHFGKWHLGSVAAGSATSPGAQGFKDWSSSPNFFENDPPLSQKGKIIHPTGEGSEVAVDLALEFVDAAVKQKRPFLAVVWFGSPHLPHEALEADREHYKSLPDRMQHYYGEITAMDRAIGKLRSRLRELDAADDTLVWFTSDNGATTPGSSGPFKGKKGSLWDGGIRVPSVLEWPSRFPEARRMAVPSSTVDILPTVLAAAGVKHPDAGRPLDGENLLPFCEPPPAATDDDDAGVAAAKASRAKPLGFWTYPQPGKPVRSGELLQEIEKAGAATAAGAGPLLTADETSAFAKKYPTDHFPGHAAWVDGRYKLHRIAREQAAPVFHLFDLANDPEEATDLATSRREQVTRMAEALEAWQASVIKSLNGEDYR